MHNNKFVTISAILTLLLICTSCTSVKRYAYEGFGIANRQPNKIMESLTINSGDHIADIGAGGGYFTFRLAEATGPKGKVYAIDVDEGIIYYLKQEAKRRNLHNVKTILAKNDDPQLPENEIDLILVSNTYHHLTDRVHYFAQIKHYLRPNAKIAIIEINGQSWFSGLFGHDTSPETIRFEMEKAGYVLEKTHEFLSDQSFQIFSNNARAKSTL